MRTLNGQKYKIQSNFVLTIIKHLHFCEIAKNNVQIMSLGLKRKIK